MKKVRLAGIAVLFLHRDSKGENEKMKAFALIVTFVALFGFNRNAGAVSLAL